MAMLSRIKFILFAIAFAIAFLNVADGQRSGHREVETTIASTVATVIGTDSEPCTAADCNERGTCFGTKVMPFCLCQLGFAGARCEGAYCDSVRDCSGRGWCMGTAAQYTCLCTLGFAGPRCDKEVPVMLSPVITQPPTTAKPTPIVVIKDPTSDVTIQRHWHKEADDGPRKPNDMPFDDDEPSPPSSRRQEHEEESERDIRHHSRDLRIYRA